MNNNKNKRHSKDSAASLYSDPLDALERAEDTRFENGFLKIKKTFIIMCCFRIYHCPEFGEIHEEDEEEEDKEEDQVLGVPKELSLSSGDLNSAAHDPMVVGVPLSRVRKTSSPAMMLSVQQQHQQPANNSSGTTGSGGSGGGSKKRENR